MPSMHERFSRWIGPMPERRTGVAGSVVLAAIGGAFLWMLVAHPIGTLTNSAALAALTAFWERKRSQHVRHVSVERTSEDIGSFARAFDRRTSVPVDPWAMRAVWNVLVPLTESKGRHIPLRPADRFDDDLEIDPEDIEYLVPLLVEQCERLPGNWQANPYYQRLGTVADLVYFVSAQPLRRSA